MNTSTTKRAARNAFWIFWGVALGKILEFIAIIYLARKLTVSGFGLFSFAQAILIYLLLIVDGGLSYLGVKEIAKDKTVIPKFSVNIFALKLATAIATYSGVLLITVLLPLAAELKVLIALTCLMVFPRALSAEWIFQGIERMEYLGMAKFIQQLFFLLFVLAAVQSVNALLLVPLLQLLSAALVSAILLFILLKSYSALDWGGLRVAAWPGLLASSVSLGLSAIFIQVYYNLDTIMLGFMKSPEVVGWYSAAYKLFFVLLGTIGVAATTVFPIVCGKFAQGRETARPFLEKYFHLLLLLVIPAVVLGVMCAGPALRLVFGGGYLGGQLALQLLLLTLLTIAVSGIYGTLVLIPAGRNNEFMYSVGLGALCNIGLNFILIPIFSLNGAALATLITEIIVLGAFYYWARREIRLDLPQYLPRPIAASAIAFLMSQALNVFWPLSGPLYLLVTVPVFSLLYLGVLALAGEQKFIIDFVTEVIGARS
jgi:O-antigen/teichoic acid export membrane protein